MIEIYPKPYAVYTCPECGSSNIEVADVLYPNLHTLADCVCTTCKFSFYHDVPIGHSLYYPAVIGKETKKLYGNEYYPWFHGALLESFLHPNDKNISVQIKSYKKCSEVIILNCLDYLYGHVLLKLFNAQHYIDRFPELGLVIVIPKSMEWLVPDGTAEVWLVDVPLREMREWFTNLNKFVKNELSRFSKIYLSLAFSHPDFSKIDISRYTRVKPFDLDKFSAQPPVVTCIVREDRLWLSSEVERAIDFASARIFFLVPFKKYLVSKQNKKVSRFCTLLQAAIPDVTINVIGLGTKRTLPAGVADLRESTISLALEKEWCNVYANSNIVIGVHGSNMLLPTALAAGFVELLPESRYDNFLQDIAASRQGILAHFLYRFIDEFTTPKQLAKMTESMLYYFEEFRQWNSSTFNEYKVYKDVSRWLRKR